MLTAVQHQFDLHLPAGRPLVPVEAIMVLADRDEDDVLNLIERGLLRYAWNIASAGAERREIRVLRDCVLDYLRADYTAITSAEEITPESLAVRILPKPSNIKIGRKEFNTIRGTEIQRRLSCSQWLVSNLIEQRELALAPVKTGPKTSPFVLHESLIQFLVRRSLRPVITTRKENP